MCAVTIEQPGSPATLGWAEQPNPVPGPGEVLIEVAASAVNRADLLQAAGHYPPPPGASPILGMECSGVVAELGRGVIDWRVGDEVCALLAGGGYATRVVVPASQVLPVPAGVDLVSVPYKGGGPAVIDLIAGSVQIYFSTIPAALAQVQAGKLRGIAVTAKTRVSLIPDVPTVAESGLPGFEVIGWFGIFVPAATPKPIVARLNKEINAALRAPEMQKRLASEGLIPGGGTSEELSNFLRAEVTKWGALIKEAGIQGS